MASLTIGKKVYTVERETIVTTDNYPGHYRHNVRALYVLSRSGIYYTVNLRADGSYSKITKAY